MTVQVTITPPGSSEVLESGGVIVVPPGGGANFTFQDVDNGTLGEVFTLAELVTEAVGDDLVVTFPDGTVLIFEDWFSEGYSTDVAFNPPLPPGLEGELEPAAGGPGGPGGPADDGGSSEAVEDFLASLFTEFGEAPEGDIDLPPDLPVELPEFLDPLFDDDIIPDDLVLLTLDPGMLMVLEDKTLSFPLPEGFGDGPVTLSGLPEGATVINADGTFPVGPGGVVAGISPEGLQIIPPLHDDKNFTVRILQGDDDTLITAEVEIMVKAVADPAKILLDRPGKEGIDIGDPEYLGGKNPVQWEMEPYLCSGDNDKPEDAMNLGSLDGTNGIALTVNGWLATAEFNDVDVYKFTITQKGRYDIDIDFGDLFERGRGRGRLVEGNEHMGRVDDADAALLLFRLDEDGNAVLVAFDDDGGAGKDPLIDGKFLKEGMYFVAVTQSANVDFGEIYDRWGEEGEKTPILFEDIFDPSEGESHGNRYDDGDYQLQIRPDREEDDITPGHMVNLMVVEDNPMKTFDGDFEFGDFSGWMALGDTAFVGDGGPDAQVPSGDTQVLLTTRSEEDPAPGQGGAQSVYEIAEFLGIDADLLKELGDFGEGEGEGEEEEPFDTVEGTAIKGKFWAKEGQELTFDWNFLTDEDVDPRDFGEMNDSAFIVIKDDLGEIVLGPITLAEFFKLAPQDQEAGSFGFDSEIGYGVFRDSEGVLQDNDATTNETGVPQPFSWTFPSTGVFHVGIGVLDKGDELFDSGLLIDNVAVDGKTPGSIKMLAVSGRGSDGDPGALFLVDQDNGEADQVGEDQTKPNEGPDKIGFTGLAVNQDSGEAFASSIEGEQGGRFSSLYRLDPWSGHVLGDPITMMLAVAIERVIDFGEVVSEGETYVEDGFILRAGGEQPRDLDIGDFDGALPSDSELVMHPVDGDDNSTQMRLTSADGKPFTLLSFDIEFENIEGDEDNERLEIRGFDAEGNEVSSFIVAAEDIAGPQTVELPPEFANVVRVDFHLRGNLEGGFEGDRVQIDNIKLLSTSLAISDLAVQPDTGFLYGIGAGNDEGNAGKLFLIDTTTGIATVIGNPGAEAGTLGGGGLAFAPGGTLFFTAIIDDGTTPGERDIDDTPVIMILDPNDGSVLATIETTFNDVPVFFDGLGVRPNDGVLFATRGDSAEIYTIDIGTGEATLVGADEGGEGGLSLSDIDFFVKPQKYLDTENKHTIEGLDLMVRDPDGTESVTFVKIDINDLHGGDDLPPGFMIGFGEIIDHRDDNGPPDKRSGDGEEWFHGRDDGNFFEDGVNWVRLNVTRIDSNNPDVGPETNPELVIQDTIKVRVFYDEDEGLVFFRIPDYLRVQNVDLGGLMWKAEKSNDQDFNIEVLVRTTETHHEFSVHPNRTFELNDEATTIVDGQTVMSTIEIEGIPEGEIIHDVNLLTKILEHTNNNLEDLIITLTSPEGTTVTLSSETDFNGRFLRWDDQANDPITNDPSRPAVTVESALAAFVGENPNGTWKISITDTSMEVMDFSGESGELNEHLEDGLRVSNPVTGKKIKTGNFGGAIDEGADNELLMDFGDQQVFEIKPQDESKTFRLFQFKIEGENLSEGQSLIIRAFDPEDPTNEIFSFTVDGFTDAVGEAGGEENLGVIKVPNDFPPEVSRVTFELDGPALGETLIIDDIKTSLAMPDGALEKWALKLKTIPEDQLKLVMFGPFGADLEEPKSISNQGGDGRDFEPTIDRIWVESVKGTIKDVDLLTSISHEDSGSLAIQLISPDGTRVLIVKGEADPSNFANVFTDTTWDDQANNPVTDAVFVDGELQENLTPESAMAAFKGEDPNGYWTIKIFDLEGFDLLTTTGEDPFDPTIGYLNDWSLKFTVFDGQELGVPHFYNSTTIMVNNKAVADKPMFGKLVVVDFGDGPPFPLFGSEGGGQELETQFGGPGGPGGPGGDIYEEDGLNFQVFRGPVILKDVVDDEDEGSRELGVSQGDALKITADGGDRFSFISFSVDKESFEGWQGESIKFFGFLDGELVAEFELDGDYIWTPETIVLPSTFMDVDKILLKTNFGHDLDDHYPDFAFLDDMKFKLPLMSVDVYEDNATRINGSFEGLAKKKIVTTNDDFFDDDSFAGWMTIGDVETTGKLNGTFPIKTIRFEGTESSNPDSYREEGIRFQDTGSQGFRLSTMDDNELLLLGGGGPDSFKMTAIGGGRFNLLDFDVQSNNFDNRSDEFVTFEAIRDGLLVDSYTLRRSDGTGIKSLDFFNVDEVRVRVSSATDDDDFIKIDNMRVQHINMAAPTDGDSQAILTTSSREGAVSDKVLEYQMGLPKGALDKLIKEHQKENDIDDAKDANAREGSAMKVTLKLDAGDKVSFDWNMLTREDAPDNYDDDFGFVFVLGPPGSGEKQVLTSTMLNPSDFDGGPIGDFDHSTGYETFLFQVPEAGSYTFVIGVLDEQDRFDTSALLVDNLSVNGWPVDPEQLTDTSSYYGAQMGVSVTDTDGSESLTSFALKYDPNSFPFSGDVIGEGEHTREIPPAVISVDGQTEVEVGDIITLKDVMRLDKWGEPVSGAVWAEVTRIYEDPHNGFITVEFTLDPEDRIQQINVTDEVGVLMPMHKDGTFDIWVLATATETNVSDTVRLINGEKVSLDFAVFTQENDQKIRNDGPKKEGEGSDDTPSISTITVAGVEGDIQDIDIITLIEHEASGELKITLVSPEGTVVTVSNQNGGDFEDLFDGTRWSDGAPNVSGFVFTVDGVVTPLGPEGPFAAFKGENPNGQWKLQVEDLSKGEMGGKAKIAVFANGSFVDIEGGEGPESDEANEVQDSLESLGHKVSSFDSVDAAGIAAALVGKDVLVIPEQEAESLLEDGGFDEDALDVIRAFVRAGGKLIIHDTFGARASDLLNELFDYSLVQESASTSGSSKAPGAIGTVFENGPASLTDPSATSGLDKDSLPPNASSIYQAGLNGSAVSTVALFDEGDGQIVYLGWDWFEAPPGPDSSSEDEPWVEVLDLAARMGDDTTGEIDGWEILIQTNMTKDQIAVESQTMVDTLTFNIAAVADQVKFSMVETMVMGTEDLLTNDLLDENGDPIPMVMPILQQGGPYEMPGYPVEALERAAQFADRSEFGFERFEIMPAIAGHDDGEEPGPEPEGGFHVKQFEGSLYSPQDTDVYSFTAYAGEKIAIVLEDGLRGKDSVRTKIELVGPNGQLIDFDVADGDPEFDPEIPDHFLAGERPFMAMETGTYYVIVRSAGGGTGATGDYTLNIGFDQESVVVDNLGYGDVKAMTDVDELFAPGQPGEGIPLNFKVETPDQDGSERISALKLNGLQPGASVSFLEADGITRHKLVDEDLDGMILIDLDDYSKEGSVYVDPVTGKLLFLDTGIGNEMTTVDFGVGKDRFVKQGRQEGFLFETTGTGDDDLDFVNQNGPDDEELELRLAHTDPAMRITVEGGDVPFAFKSFNIEDAKLGEIFDLKITGFKNGHQLAELKIAGDSEDLLGTVELPDGFGDVDEVFVEIVVSGGNGEEHFVVLDDFQFARGGLDLRLHPADDDGDNMWVGLQVETTESMPMDPDNPNIVETTWTTFMGEMQNIDFDVPGPMRQGSYEEDGFIFTAPGGDGIRKGQGGEKKSVGPNNAITMNSGGDPKKVLVFDNEEFVDSFDGEIGAAESDEIQASLEAFGHDVMTFTSLSGEDLEDLLEGKDVLVIPELGRTDPDEFDDLVNNLGEVIRDFVQDGGKLITGGSALNMNLLSKLFGYELADDGGAGESALTDAASSTFFKNAPEELDDNEDQVAITKDSLPDSATSIYEDEQDNTTVALFEEGSGHIVYLAWDWFSAAPDSSLFIPGEQDGGWLKVLNTAVTMSADKDLVLHGPEFEYDDEREEPSALIASMTHNTGKPFDLISFDIDFSNLQRNEPDGEHEGDDEVLRVTGFDEFGNEVDSLVIHLGDYESGAQDLTIALPATFRQVSRVDFEIEELIEHAGLGNFFDSRVQIDNVMVKGPATIDVTIKEIADDPTLNVPGDATFCEDNAEHMKDEWGKPIHPVMFVGGMPMYPVPITAAVSDTDGSEAITRIVVASDLADMNVPLDGVKYLIGDQEIGPLSHIQGEESAVEIKVLGKGVGASPQTRFDAKAYADGDNLIIELDASQRPQEVDLSFMKVMLPQHKDGKFTFDVEVRSTEVTLQTYRLDFNHPEGVGDETFYAEDGFAFSGRFARGDTPGDGDFDRELILPNASGTGAHAMLVAQNGEAFDLVRLDIQFENLESTFPPPNEILIIRGLDENDDVVASETVRFNGSILNGPQEWTIELPVGFRGVSKVRFSLPDESRDFDADRVHIDNIIVQQVPSDGPNAVDHAVTHDSFMLTVLPVADKAMVGEPVTVKFGDIPLGFPGLYQESGMVFRAISSNGFAIVEDDGPSNGEAELRLEGGGFPDGFSIKHMDGSSDFTFHSFSLETSTLESNNEVVFIALQDGEEVGRYTIVNNPGPGVYELPASFMKVDEVKVFIDAEGDRRFDKFIMDDLTFKVPLDMVMVHEDNAMPVIGDPMQIAVFDDHDFVDSEGNPSSNNEADEIRLSLQALGHSALAFENDNSPGAWAGALENMDVLVIPELERSFSSEIDSLATSVGEVIREFVQAGGKLIIGGSREGKAAEFLNKVFAADSFSLTEAHTSDSGAAVHKKVAGADGTPFVMAPDSLLENFRSSGLKVDDLPPSAKSAYETEHDGMTFSVVTQFPIGMGKITYLGWDWNDALPSSGSQDGGWLQILDLAARDTMMWVDKESIYDLPFKAQVVDTDGSESLTKIKLTLTELGADGVVDFRWTHLGEPIQTSDELTFVNSSFEYEPNGLLNGLPPHAVATVDGNMLILEFADEFRFQKVQLDELGIELPPHRHGEFNIAYEVMTKETNPMLEGEDFKKYAETATISDSFAFIVGAVADKPTIEFQTVVDKPYELEAPDESFANGIGSALDLGSLPDGGALNVGGYISTDHPNDVDFFKFTIEEDGTYFFDIDGGIGGDGSVDTFLSIFDDTSTLIAVDNDTSPVDPGSSSEMDSFIGGLFLEAGMYFAAVSQFDNLPLGLIGTDIPHLPIGGREVIGADAGESTFGNEIAGEGSGDYWLQIRSQVDDVPLGGDANPMVMGEQGEPISLAFRISTPDVDGSEGLIDIKITGFPVVDDNPESPPFGINGFLTYTNNAGGQEMLDIGTDGQASFSLAQYASSSVAIANQLGITQVVDLGGLGSKKVVMVDTGPDGINLRYHPPGDFVSSEEKIEDIITFLGFDGDVPFYSEDGYILRAEEDGYDGVEDLDIEELEAGDSAMRMHPNSTGPSTKFSLEAEDGEAFCLHAFDIVRENIENGESLVIKAFDEFGTETASRTIDFTGTGATSQDNNDVGNIDLTGNSDFEGVHRVEFRLTGQLAGKFQGDALFLDNFRVSQARPETLEITVNTQEMFAPGKVMENMQTIEVDLLIKPEIDEEGPPPPDPTEDFHAFDDKVFTNDADEIEIPLKALLANDYLLGSSLDQTDFSFEIVNGSYTGGGSISVDDNGTSGMDAADTVRIVGVEDAQFQYEIKNNGLTATAVVMITQVDGLSIVGDPDMESILIADSNPSSTQTMTGSSGDDFFIVEHDSPVEITDDTGGFDTILPSMETNLNPFGLRLISGFDTDSDIERIDGSMYPNNVDIRPGESGVYWDFSETELAGIRQVLGSGSADSIVGSEGADTIIGGAGDDVIDGGGGDDSIAGGAGDDVIMGGADNDVLEGGTGNDTLFGGDGDDLLIGSTTSDQTSTQEFNGGDGMDTFRLLSMDTFSGVPFLFDVRGDGMVTINDFTIGEDKLQIDVTAVPSNPTLADLDAIVTPGGGAGKIQFADDGTDTTITFFDLSAPGNDTAVVLKNITSDGSVGSTIDNFTELDAILNTGGTPIDFV